MPIINKAANFRADYILDRLTLMIFILSPYRVHLDGLDIALFPKMHLRLFHFILSTSSLGLKPKSSSFVWVALLALFTLSPLAFAVENTKTNQPQTWVTKKVSVNTDIRIEPTTRNGEDFEIVHLPNGEFVEIKVDLNSSAIVNSQLNPNEINQLREESRKALELTLRAVLSEDFNGAISVNDINEAVVINLSEKSDKQKPVNLFNKVFAYNNDLYRAAPSNLRASEKLKRFIQMAWQFVFVETLHAGVKYFKQFELVRPRFTEFGFAMVFKIEPQVFIGKFNPTQKIKKLSRNYALYFEISYDRIARKINLRTRYRREKGTGGLGLPAFKAELKIFESDGADKAYKGKSWYPISPPLVSFALDSSEHYFAQGITIGFNTGDLVPGSTLTNTFTQFVQRTDHVISVTEVPRAVSVQFENAISNSKSKNAKPLIMCSQLIFN